MGAAGRHPFITAFVLLVLAIVGVVGSTAVAVWRAAHHDDASTLDSADVIVVLGAAQYNGDPSPVFRARLDHAALLYGQDRAPVVLVLGGKQPGDVTTEAQAGADYLIGKGLPAGAVVSEPVGNTTLQSLSAAAGWMDRRGLGSAFLVSDPWHNLRIERMASDLGIDGHASATWTSAAVSEQSRMSGYFRETLAYLYYRITGR